MTINGSQVNTKESLVLNLDPAEGMVVGRKLGGPATDDTMYKGSLDELRISTRIYSAGRIKLNYETQRMNSKAVQIQN